MKKMLYALVSFAIVVICGIGGFLIGRCTAPQGEDSSAVSNDAAFYQTFYATIEEVNGNSLLIKGLEVNDVNGRGEFYATIDDDTVVEWRCATISPEELKVGDTISITHTGSIAETYPASIDKTVRIQLLDDEK